MPERRNTAERRPWHLAFLDKTNVTVTTICALACIYTRSACIVYFCAGTVACSLSVKVIKKAIRQPRPVMGPGRYMKKTYGMPSTHAASISYLGTALPLACFYLPLHRSLPSIAAQAWIIAVPWATLVAFSRVWLGHHTWPQVAVGCAYGTSFAVGWYSLWVHRLSAYGEVIEDMVERLLGF